MIHVLTKHLMFLVYSGFHDNEVGNACYLVVSDVKSMESNFFCLLGFASLCDHENY